MFGNVMQHDSTKKNLVDFVKPYFSSMFLQFQFKNWLYLKAYALYHRLALAL